VRRLAAVSWALCAAACARDATAPSAGSHAYTYSITPPPAGSWVLRVEARFHHAASSRLVAPSAEAVREIELLEGDRRRALDREGDAWIAPACSADCTVRYTVDLDVLASTCHRFDCSRRVGGAVIGPASTWMLVPEPSGDAVVRVNVNGPDVARMATGLRRAADGGFVFDARELSEASYTAFGEFRGRRIDVAGARLDVALLGAPLAMGDDAVLDWVHGGASCVASLFGRFPVDATIFVVPMQGADEVVFGRVLSLAGASVALLFGSEARPETAHGDWVVVHELFHLGCPSFVGEGHWLEEGLATYYEPLLRERAGWMTQADLWRHFTREMRRGVRRRGEPPSLEERDDINSTYWGGALFALMVDVRIREATGGRRALDDVMRSVLGRLGDATHVARVADFIRAGDEETGTNVLADEYARFALAGEAVDLGSLWASLGVQTQGDDAVSLRDDAPLAAVRRSIASGDRH